VTWDENREEMQAILQKDINELLVKRNLLPNSIKIVIDPPLEPVPLTPEGQLVMDYFSEAMDRMIAGEQLVLPEVVVEEEKP
jgi:hypothetical protein